MKKNSIKLLTLAVITSALFSLTAHAASVNVLVGDKDGFGIACPNTGSCPDLSNPPIDNRTAGEAAAVNGAQITDVYTAIYPFYGPNSTSTADVLLPFSGTLLSGTVSFGAGDFQSSDFGALTADINGSPVSFSFNDGRFVTAIHSFTLDATELAAANAAGQVILHLDRGFSGDFVSFDYFELNGESTESVPEPSSVALLGSSLAGLVIVGRRRRK